MQLGPASGLPDRIKGEVTIACIVPRAGEVTDAAELAAFCHKHLAAYKVPRRFDLHTEQPLTPAGKPRKRDIARQKLEAGS